ncbi:serine/threonine protein kinase [Thermosporothrix hazakensis]|jgi:serine/threonine protein kinase|uniref:Serine/threonine protein kinase n=2 Tax=Thermosporothrix TaxID=768650 RepID=A0A326UPB0_THEHA|nr:protein kinase [Thermosporothrix hazakensis]PZW32042.1 serine/threonine protein kinase [Thermosporothrix hazakensis]BBH91485.1 hypothetical protein KTC_62360 [Thermosporothrix sp. COM3]GCE49630.1 hypothetical protein KTH_44990 [Thermosporothrix hazakensis]
MIETVPSGTVLHGRYRIERVLGSGGFGHVYLGLDLTTSLHYAVKEYLVTGASGQEQLKHEANVLNQLHHPNLPALQDAFMERGRYYMVLNYIEGNDLTDLIRIARQRNDIVPISRIMGWLLAICDAVHFLHNQRPPVIHRDIKPDNIRITSDGTAVLVDLGNAKAAADGARTLFFIRHQGTPGYAPPEQYPGGAGTDIRSDVYALGGTLFFALTAHEPPSVSIRNQAMQQGRPDLPTLQEVLANNPPEETPEQQAARQFRLGGPKPGKPAPRHIRHVAQLGTLPPQLLQQLNKVIQRAMALRPKDRYQSVADFAHDLKKILSALPHPPQPPQPTKQDHSTQPALDMVYEQMMADGKIKQGSPDTATSPMPDHSTQAAHCPRCNAPLQPHTQRCPNCGTTLSSQPTPMNTAQQGAGDQTLFIKQNNGIFQQAQAAYQAQSAAPAATMPKQAQTPGFSGPIPAQSASGPHSNQMMYASGGQTGAQPRSHAPASHSQPRSRLIILALVAVVVLILLIGLFLVLK